jgi:hypothetical protein
MRHRFIISAGRAGTTFMARALNMHPDVCCQLESHHLPLLIEAFGDRPASARAFLAVLDQARFSTGTTTISFSLDSFDIPDETFFDWRQSLIAGNDEMTIADFQEALAGFFLNATGKRIFVDKTPCYGWRLPQLHAALKDVLVVNMVRDCAPSVLSMARHPGFMAKLRLNETNWTDVLLNHRYWALDDPTPLEGYEDWAAMSQLWALRTDVANTHAGLPKVADLRYEDLMDAPEVFLRGLCTELDIPFDPNWARDVAQSLTPSQTAPTFSADLTALLDVPGISALRDRLGYGDAARNSALNSGLLRRMFSRKS